MDKDSAISWLQGVAERVQKCASDASTVIFPSSMKTIPFTLPPNPRAMSPRRAAPEGPISPRKGVVPVVPERREDSATNLANISSDPVSPATRDPWESLLAVTESRGAHSLGSLDPSLYKLCDDDDDYELPEGHIGRVWFAVEYERESEKLLVTLIKAKNLPSRTLGSTNGCDPFIKLYLLPDERRYLQSKFKKKTCNPKFDESFVFQVSNKALDERVLRLTVFDIDRHRRHQVVGHALYPLKEHNYDSNERVVIWRDLEKELVEASSDKGEINIGLCYNGNLERISVSIFDGRNFKRQGFTTQDYYVKISLLYQGKVMKAKKTEIARKVQDSPAFNESFTFKLEKNSLDVSSVTIAVMQYFAGQKDKQLGRVVLGSFMFARGKELDHWNEMLSKERDQVSHWHVLT